MLKKCYSIKRQIKHVGFELALKPMNALCRPQVCWGAAIRRRRLTVGPCFHFRYSISLEAVPEDLRVIEGSKQV